MEEDSEGEVKQKIMFQKFGVLQANIPPGPVPPQYPHPLFQPVGRNLLRVGAA